MCRQWVNQATVWPQRLLALRYPLPPLPEQRRIAEILDKADALRAKRRAALAQLDTLTQSIFLDMFGDPRHGSRQMADIEAWRALGLPYEWFPGLGEALLRARRPLLAHPEREAR